MTTGPAISVERLGKRYVLGHQRPDTLRDSLALKVGRWFRRGPRTELEEFWALRDVSFEVRPGEVVGIIGRNGAGKSTLLKVLSRITEPTRGRAVIRGRIASLLEVGTGFHPELSGRENIFLNGAILGMTRAEIARKFDEIVAFAEVERFLDTPVKHYSSGMYVRLAFAVAAHLEPEILIVDEVLAVGDAQFQKKCLGKMQDVARDEGRTILFVSHNLSVVQSLCQRVLFLGEGQVRFLGEPAHAIEHYLGAHSADRFERPAPPAARCHIASAEVRVDNDVGRPSVQVGLRLEASRPITVALEGRLFDEQGQLFGFGALGTFEESKLLALPAGGSAVRCRFDASQLANGHYRLKVRVVQPFVEVLDEPDDALSFELAEPPAPGASHRLPQSWRCGSVLLGFERLP